VPGPDSIPSIKIKQEEKEKGRKEEERENSFVSDSLSV
jgi:hypothetical protein